MEKQICLSLVYQHLLRVSPGLAEEFDDKYKPEKALVKAEEVLARWEEEQLARIFVFNHLKEVAPALVEEFKDAYFFAKDEALLNIESMWTNWDEEKLARGLVYNHLKKVQPALAKEFKDKRKANLFSCTEKLMIGTNDPEEVIDRRNRDIFVEQRKVQEVGMGRSRPIFFTDNEVKRLESALMLKEDAKSVAKEMGRSYESVRRKLYSMKNAVGQSLKLRVQEGGKGQRRRIFFMDNEMKRLERALMLKEDPKSVAKEMGKSYVSVRQKLYYMKIKNAVGERLILGKLSAKEDERLRQAIADKEDYKMVAKEMGRDPKTVYDRMIRLRINPESQVKTTRFTLEEDLVILDKVAPKFAAQRLSSTGFLSNTAISELATGLQKTPKSVSKRWDMNLQPWLLQHFTGTSGLRVERVLSSLVAKEYKDTKEIDWRKLVQQHKEFQGHTYRSLNGIYHNILLGARRKLKGSVTLQQVESFASETYGAGMGKKETASIEAHREKFIFAFREKIEKLQINIKIYGCFKLIWAHNNEE